MFGFRAIDLLVRSTKMWMGFVFSFPFFFFSYNYGEDYFLLLKKKYTELEIALVLMKSAV